MQLRDYLKGKDRKQFAKQLETSVHYLNNLCQRPHQAGKKIALRIQRQTGNKVTLRDMWTQ